MSRLDTWLRSRADRCSGCGWHVPTMGHGSACAPVAPTKGEVLSAVNEAAADDDKARIDAAILTVARRGRVFSANDVRDALPAELAEGGLMGARFNALARQHFEHVGYTPSTKGNTHGHDIKTWRLRAA